MNDFTAAGFPGKRLTQVTYPKFAVDKLPRTNLPRLKGFTAGGKLLAIVGNEDISSGLVGPSVDYSPASAVEIGRNIVLRRAAATAAPPTPAARKD